MRLLAYCVMASLLLTSFCPAAAEDWDLETFEEQLTALCLKQNHREALNLTEQAVQKLQQLGQDGTYDMAVCLGVLGELHYVAGDRKKSKGYTGKAMKLMDKLAAADPEDFMNGREMMPAFDALDGSLKGLSGMPIIPYCRWKVQHTMKEHGETAPETAMGMKDLAEAYRTDRQYKRALRYCVLAGRKLKKGKVNISPHMASIYYLMSRIYWEMEQPEKREKFLKSSIKLFEKVDVKNDPLFMMDLLTARMELQRIARAKGGGESLSGDGDSGTSAGNEEAERHAKRCRANLRLLEGSIDHWDMEINAGCINGGNDCALGDADGNPTEQAQVLMPDYLREFPRCEEGGIYTFRAKDSTVECSVHGTVKDIDR